LIKIRQKTNQPQIGPLLSFSFGFAFTQRERRAFLVFLLAFILTTSAERITAPTLAFPFLRKKGILATQFLFEAEGLAAGLS
jgi:hypothetical protein